MRVAPVALYTLGDEELLSRRAVEQARITHHHPLSDAACVLVGRLVHGACLGRSLAWLRGCAGTRVARCCSTPPRAGATPPTRRSTR